MFKIALGMGLLMQVLTSSAQPLIINANQIQGCAPLVVQLSSNMPGLPNGSYNWNLGNGNVSVISMPIATYTTPGTYNVALTVNDNGTVYTDLQTITVFQKPTANFGTQGGLTSGCTPLIINFLNGSSAGSSPISSWIWNYGDGNSQTFSTPVSPSHTYTTAGNFSVNLQVLDGNGCSDDKTINNLIHPSVGPDQQWYPNPGVFCQIPANVNIVNNITGNNTYFWTTSDGQTSNLSAPDFTFNLLNQTITITLLAIDNAGCESTASRTVTIGNVESMFTLPDYICRGESFVPDNNTSIGNLYEWSFNGISSSNIEPTIPCNTAGWNTITLTSTLNGDCSDTFADSIYVEYVQANYVLEYPYVCELPITQHYLNTTITNSLLGTYSSQWSLEWAGNSTQQSPTFLYSYIAELFGDYTHFFYDTLIVTSPLGCKDTATTVTDVYLPHNWILVNALGGCIPFIPTVEHDSWFTICPYDSIISYFWDFGDGFTSTLEVPPSHTYGDTGNFNLSLVITTAHGCQDTANVLLAVGDTTNVPQFYITGNNVFCGSDTVHIINNSIVNTNNVGWNWDVEGEILLDGISPDVLPLDTGWQDVTLFMSNGLCVEILTIENLFYVNGPITQMFLEGNCDSSYYYKFDLSVGLAYDDFVWDFGDGVLDSINAPETNHWYTQSMNPDATIYSINYSTGCEYWDTLSFEVRDSKALISLPIDSACNYEVFEFSSFHTRDSYEIDFMGVDYMYFWNFGDSTWFYYNTFFGLDSSLTYATNDTLVYHSFNAPGVYEVMLTIVDANVCWDTAIVLVTVLGPEPEFAMVMVDNCTPVSVDFLNLTTHNIPIVQWEWDFGLADTSMAFEPPGQLYSSSGLYSVSLTATDSLGCTGIQVQEIMSSQPYPDFLISDTLLCLGDTLLFTNYSTYLFPNPVFTYFVGSSDSIIGFEPEMILTHPGDFNVWMEVNDGGCIKSTDTLSFEIEIQTPVFDIISTVSGTCFPVSVSFTYEPYVNYFSMLYWDFGNGAISTVQNPENVFSQPGIYTVSLFINTSGGCSGVSSDSIKIGGAYAEFSISDNTLCLGDSLMVLMDSANNVGNLIIDFGDGNSSVEDSIWHSYLNPGLNDSLILYITYYDINGVCPATDSAQILLLDVRPDFLIGIADSDTSGCAPHVVQFYNQSSNANEYHWSFGDGQNSILIDPVHNYIDPGFYDVELSVTNTEHGCDDVRLNKFIHVYPIPEINTSAEFAICNGDTIQLYLQASEVYTYLWSPGEFMLDSTAQNPFVFPSSSTIFSVTATNMYNCKKDTSHYVFVQSEPELNLNDTSIIVGQSVIYDYTGLQQIEFVWTPDTAMSGPYSAYPTFYPLNSAMYYVEVSGYAGDQLCFTLLDSLYIDVMWKFSLDMPSLFSPNGDGHNDFLYVRGWGIHELLEFSIYNRWGERIYRSNDIEQGWDGTYKGVMQPAETYFYYVRVRMFSEEIFEKSGSTTLIH
ncbi:MAG: PKD domain-containing protein [Bacteroidales bacterium]|nr:PKD domain-containing protein [Bacteroidales bacterium]